MDLGQGIEQQHETALPGRLGVALGLTTGSVTAMLDRLEALGYVTRSRDPADRRKVIVRATAQATQRVWVEIYQPLTEEGLAGIAHTATPSGPVFVTTSAEAVSSTSGNWLAAPRPCRRP
jgi:hypothetical protein